MTQYEIITSTKYKGTHGTSHSRALSIHSGSFHKPTYSGRAGSGVYFWAYDRDPSLAKELAIRWWQKSHDDGEYSCDDCKEHAVIFANIDIEKKDTINLDCLELREMLSRLIKQNRVNSFSDKAKVYEIFLNRIEARRNTPYELIGVFLDPPGSTPHHWLSKSQPAYIVRSNAIGKINTNKIETGCKSTCRG